jgi:RNA polymerase sigma factor (sigma-70 family)
MVRKLTDEEIVLGITSEDRREVNAAIRSLYDHHVGIIRRYVRSHGGSTADSDDLVQVVVLDFIKVVRSGGFQVKEGRTLDVYLHVICKNRWLNVLRQRSQVTLYPQDELPEVEAAQSVETAATPLEEREEMDYYRRQFERLSERCRTILTAQRRDDMTMKEIAELMGFENERVAINEKYKCLQKLKDLLKHHETENTARTNGMD